MPHVAVVLPCYRVTHAILDVLRALPPTVSTIICVDDACPDHSGALITAHIRDPRVVVLRHETNQGVGGAMITGYREAMARGAEIVVKVDGDGQMDPVLLPRFIRPIVDGEADYTKGNRFYTPEGVLAMPWARLLGNAVLSFLSKLSTGYWQVFDPTNGYTAIHVTALRLIPLDKVSRRYFFESDLLFRLGTVRAVVRDIPMDARYGDEHSYLSPWRVVIPFLHRHCVNSMKRFVYSYLLRDFNVASVLALLGAGLVSAGSIFGVVRWIESSRSGIPATAGTVMLSALPVALGMQALLGAMTYDIANVPTTPLSGLWLE